MAKYEKQIGLRVSRLREQQGLTTTELAKRVGISQAQISRLENGKQGFRSATLARIASALDVRPGYFFQEDGENTLPLSASLSDALGRREFHDFVDRLAKAYAEDPAVLNALVQELREHA